MYGFARSAVSLAALLSVVSTVTASPARAECLLARSDELAALSSCGDTALLSSCLAGVPQDATVDVVKQCFTSAGCSAEDSAIESASALKLCEQGLEGAELRIRGGMENFPYITDAAALGARQTAVHSIQCSTDTTITTTVCTAVVDGDRTTQSCTPTPMITQVCDRANVCMKDSKGVDICMVRKDMPTTDGLIVTIFLVVVFVIGVGTMIFLCCKDRREAKRIRAQHEAAQIAKSQKMAAASAGPAPGPPGPPAHGQDPFGDPNRQH